MKRLNFERATGKFGFRSLLPPECLDRNPFLTKGNFPVAKANANASPAQIFPSASVKLGDEAIKSGGFPQVGKTEKITRIKFTNY